ncbi:histidinol dehydrogenase [Paenibacillus allorhizosphaerae]|uniref:Histidinol dehydrogenase n=1 Tax=Paenibacillus allorhizosphaerae TaxID=2849866 RepID=A0ABM8VDE1_9BACL|nr:histidinol dehydrogenase [Paenibacillus allorhizosphaerae]CAG7627246.1 Histidinol dehydrogenase [Paenibacillus allorhizosphaerae]
MKTMICDYPKDRAKLKERFAAHKKLFDRSMMTGIYAIFEDIAEKGDAGVKEATRRFDDVALDDIVLPGDYAAQCIASLAAPLREAIDQTIRNVMQVNLALLPTSWELEIRPGTLIGESVSPLDSVGIWIPARKGPLLSTSIMLVAAAKAAGVPRIVVGMPPMRDGLGDPGTVAAAKLAGADEFVVGNGVAVIAAFCQGTASIPEVDGVFGPGPGGIAAAMSAAVAYGKKTVVGLGPTESAIIADASADASRTAYDLINEAEHGPDSVSLLVTTDRALAVEVERLLRQYIEEVEDDKRRRNLRQVFGDDGRGTIVVATDIESACEFVNDFAPEHVMVVCNSEREAVVRERLRHAGEILLGEYTPFSAANYAIGITAVLPTNGFAKAFSGVTSKDMVKYSTIGKIDQNALKELLPVIRQMGSYEQLPSHVKAVEIRV